MKHIIKMGIIISAIFLVQFLSSCSLELDQLLSVGNNFVNAGTRVAMIDTFSVSLSTIVVDSFSTSNTETALVGYYNEVKTGSTAAKSFFQIQLPKDEDIKVEDIFDSVTLVLNYSSYYQGDTTKVFFMSVNRLSEDIEVDDNGYLYNSSFFSYFPTPLGAISFKPRPNSTKSIEIKLSDSFGKDLFDKLMYSSEEVSDNEDFTNYLKGLVLVPDNDVNQAVLGFGLSDSTMMMRIYGHRVDEELENWELDFPVINNSSRFNQIISDRSSTSLAGLVEQKNGLHSSQTGNASFVKGGAGLMTSISFPWLGSLLEITDGELFRAEIVLHPIINDSNSALLPSGYFLYEGDKYNNLEGTYADSEGIISYGLVETDRLYNESSIIFDITDFVKYEMYDSYFDKEHTFILSYDNPAYTASCNQVEIGGFQNKSYKPSLNIYFIYYE